ncbi:MAG: PEP-CTERM sorting domain-containing protein [Luteolibacter sp.]
MKHLFLSSLLACGICQGSTTLIDVTFPSGTGTNPTFLEIDNGVGSNSWTQSTGVLSTSTSNNSAVGAASDTTIDFSALGSDSLVLTVTVASVTGTPTANGYFIGFQRRINGGTGDDLWNNLSTAFGLVIPGANSVGNGVRHIGIGGNAGSGRYQGSDYGVATLASIQDGFGMTLTVNSLGWEIAITGLEDASAAAITGGSGSWGTGGINTWESFQTDMRVGASYQTDAGAGDMTLSKITLTQVPEPSTLALLALGGLGLLRRRRN